MDKDQTLRTYFPAIDKLHPMQDEAIDLLLAGENVLALLPTGYGKSLIYQVAGLALGTSTIVVSPLVALMRQQAQQLQDRGLSALNLSGMGSVEQARRLTDMAQHGLPQFVFTSPERLSNDGYFEHVLAMRRDDIGLVVVDEAHCVSQWGEGFRPAYRSIPVALNRIFGTSWPRMLCLTATLKREKRWGASVVLRVWARHRRALPALQRGA